MLTTTEKAHKGLISLDALVNALRERGEITDEENDKIEELYQLLHDLID